LPTVGVRFKAVRTRKIQYYRVSQKTDPLVYFDDNFGKYGYGPILTTFSLLQVQCSRIRILRFFQISKKHDFLRFFEMTYQKVVKSQQKFSPQSVKMSSRTLLSDHCNSIPSSQSVIYSIEILAAKFPVVMGTYKHLSHTVLIA